MHPATGEDVPFEDYMVKRFRRSAAGDDEQLPSDIRPPLVLQKTLNYLLEEVINGPEALSKVHKFVWDRTRAIRNDFSIQQVTKPDDVRIAMDCFERIARFHILALHQLSLPENVENSDFDAHQELEQLVKTLLSLTYYYDDNRGIVTSPNEAEFRAYTIIIEIENPRPRLEQRAGTWPKHVLEDQQVQMALSLYAMCGGIEDGKGNWFAGTSFELAPGNPRSFFPFLKSPKVPYLLACVTEISFYYIRGLILESICEEFKDGMANSQERKNWSAEDVQAILGFDDVDQTSGFCLSHGLPMKFIKDKTNLDLDRGEFKRGICPHLESYLRLLIRPQSIGEAVHRCFPKKSLKTREPFAPTWRLLMACGLLKKVSKRHWMTSRHLCANLMNHSSSVTIRMVVKWIILPPKMQHVIRLSRL